MFIIFAHLMTFYKLYKTLRSGYSKLRPILLELVKDSATKIDDKAVNVLDGIFFQDDK